ncbi:uncharacterized protein LOC117102242, partial [Anneissia japonica]|uniref:uncharacterized protein LOC117102242 n=1 Tax=Anneissia japonica TaxID=1529436 RepID=UPI00142565F0
MSGNIAAGTFTAEMFNQKEETPTEDVASGSITPNLNNLALEPPNILNNSDTGENQSTPHDENSEEKPKFSDPFVLNLPPELKDQLINSLRKNDIEENQEMNLKLETPEKSVDDSLSNNIEGTPKFTDNLVDIKPTLPERNHITDALESNLEMFTALGGIDRASSADSEATSSRSSRIMRSVSNDDDASSQSSSVRSHQRQGSTGISSGPNRNWVQFDEPQRPGRPYIPIQYT